MLFAALALAAGGTASLYGTTVTATLPEYSGAYYDSGFPKDPVSAGTFTFSIPPGEYITAATYSSSFGNSAFPNSAGVEVRINGVLAGVCRPYSACDLQHTPLPFSYSFQPSEFGALTSGTASVMVTQISGHINRLGVQTLTLITAPPGNTPPPFGTVDTPQANSTGIAGALGVTGWALSSVAVQSVGIWRDPVSGESPNGLVFLLNASMIAGARPDVASAYPTFPYNTTGWGAQILTNMLPNTTGISGTGNGTYRLHAIATDVFSHSTELGTRTVTADNAHSVLPFGTIDTPAQGQTVTGSSVVNFGWALTPNPANIIPTDGSTIWVYVDNQPVGHPVYNNYRSDVATLFPGLQNSAGAIGYYILDTTQLTNGLHSISWAVTDSANHAQGIGSRFFNVQN